MVGLTQFEEEVLAKITVATGEVVKGQGFLMLKETLQHAKRRIALERTREMAQEI